MAVSDSHQIVRVHVSVKKASIITMKKTQGKEGGGALKREEEEEAKLILNAIAISRCVHASVPVSNCCRRHQLIVTMGKKKIL
jgi:hypothetical protein